MEAFGFEATWDPNAIPVNRAVAAIHKDGRIVNAVSRIECTLEAFKEMVRDGNASILPAPIPLISSYGELEILGVNTAVPFAGIAFPSNPKLVEASGTFGNINYYVIRTHQLDFHASLVGQRIYDAVRADPGDFVKLRAYTQIGEVLNPHNPLIAAAATLLAKERSRALKVGAALMRSPEDLKAFLSGCRRLGLPV